MVFHTQIQQDEDKPRKIEVFTRRNLVPADAVVSVLARVLTLVIPGMSVR